MNLIRCVGLAVLCVIGLDEAAHAQEATDWQFAVYPVLVWVPVEIGVDIDVPPADGDGGALGQIVDSRFDGAFFGGGAAWNGPWRIEAYGIWAAFGGDRVERPRLTVDLDIVYGDFKVGRRIAPDLYVAGGLRRVALNYDVVVGDLPRFAGEPGVWDPLVGIGWHRIRPKFEWHASLEGGGFGVGADVDIGATFRVDWKPIRHFGFSGGYNFLYLKVSDSIAGRTVIVEPALHGPAAGIGFYF